jgi:hypothetical protein
VAKCTQAVAPLAWEAFEEYKVRGASFSATELSYLKRMIAGEGLPVDAFDGSKSLLKEFEQKLGMSLTTMQSETLVMPGVPVLTNGNGAH